MEFMKKFKSIAEIKTELERIGYRIPSWCGMPIEDHYFDIGGGCWGIHGGYVKKYGKDYCRKCKYFKENKI